MFSEIEVKAKVKLRYSESRLAHQKIAGDEDNINIERVFAMREEASPFLFCSANAPQKLRLLQ